METNRIQTGDRIKTLIYNEEPTLLFSTEYTDTPTVAAAIRRAYRDSDLPEDIRDFTFVVVNMTTGTEEKYRVNASNHIRIIL